jgi:hypothetical protein
MAAAVALGKMIPEAKVEEARPVRRIERSPNAAAAIRNDVARARIPRPGRLSRRGDMAEGAIVLRWELK